jgi:hypothetical protein
MQLGQAAGVAAVMAAKNRGPVQIVNTDSLQQILRKDGVLFNRDEKNWISNDKP